MANQLPDFDRLAEIMITRHWLSQQDADLQLQEATELLKIRNVQGTQLVNQVETIQRDGMAFREDFRTLANQVETIQRDGAAFREEFHEEFRVFSVNTTASINNLRVDLDELRQLTAARVIR